MRRKQKLSYALGGFALGVLLTCGVWLWADRVDPGAGLESAPPETVSAPPIAVPDETILPQESAAVSESATPAPTAQPSGTWDSAAVYTGAIPSAMGAAATGPSGGPRGKRRAAATYGRIWALWTASPPSPRGWTTSPLMPSRPKIQS